MFHPPRWKSFHALRVVRLDPAGVPTDWGPDNAIFPGRVRVTGVWDGEVITVEEQGPDRRPDWAAPTFRPPCPPPDGGWDTSTRHHDVPELEALRASGAIVRDCWLCEPGGAHVLIVAASEVDVVRRVLSPWLPRRLCVVVNRYSADQMRGVEQNFEAHSREWAFQIWSFRGLDEEGQPYARAELLRVTDDLAAWADTLPDGLLDLRPIMTPA